jgi:hypothetical protein
MQAQLAGHASLPLLISIAFSIALVAEAIAHLAVHKSPLGERLLRNRNVFQ